MTRNRRSRRLMRQRTWGPGSYDPWFHNLIHPYRRAVLRLQAIARQPGSRFDDPERVAAAAEVDRIARQMWATR